MFGALQPPKIILYSDLDWFSVDPEHTLFFFALLITGMLQVMVIKCMKIGEECRS